jgi:2,2-dialkylglycine decarboxylase (pyruvate)
VTCCVVILHLPDRRGGSAAKRALCIRAAANKIPPMIEGTASVNTDLRDAAREYLVRYGGDVFPNLFVSAKGSVVRDDTGREILDFTSGQMCATIGHNHPAIVEAVHSAGAKAFHLFSGMIPEVVAQLGMTVARDWMPEGLTKSLFINTGAESNEAALRMAKLHTGGYEVLAVGGSWHGVTGGTSAVSFASDRKGYGVPTPGVFVMPEPNSYRPYIDRGDEESSALACLELGLKMFDMQSTGRPAAIIIEPVISAGGVLVPPAAYMRALRRAADERGMLLIFDEAQTAFGRLGFRTGAEMFGVTPDIMSVSKTLGGGLPLAATITTPAIEESAFRKGFNFYTSHVSDPLPAEVGLAVLRVIAEEHLIERAREIGGYLRGRLEQLQQRYEPIGDVRGAGLLLGVELVKDRETREPNHALGALTTSKCFEMGLSMNIRRRPERGSVWRIAPPLTVSTDEIDRAVTILDQALRESLDELAGSTA